MVSPNYEHLKYAPQWSQVFPDAVKIGPPGIAARLPEILWNTSYGGGSSSSGDAVYEDSIEAIYFDCEEVFGKPFFSETNYYHKKSKTFFCADR